MGLGGYFYEILSVILVVILEYHPEVKGYINSTDELEAKVDQLWGLWEKGGRIDIALAKKCLSEAVDLSPNIQKREVYLGHCRQVAERCKEAGEAITKKYPALEKSLNPQLLEFLGLTEDSFYLIGGDGTNNGNRIDSNPFHEILTYMQLAYIGKEKYAKQIALHGVSFGILAAEHKKGNFTCVPIPEHRNLELDILTAMDMLCTDKYLAENRDIQSAFEERVRDIRNRRDKKHPVVVGLNGADKDRLLKTILRVDSMVRGYLSEEVMNQHYNL